MINFIVILVTALGFYLAGYRDGMGFGQMQYKKVCAMYEEILDAAHNVIASHEFLVSDRDRPNFTVPNKQVRDKAILKLIYAIGNSRLASPTRGKEVGNV